MKDVTHQDPHNNLGGALKRSRRDRPVPIKDLIKNVITKQIRILIATIHHHITSQILHGQVDIADDIVYLHSQIIITSTHILRYVRVIDASLSPIITPTRALIAGVISLVMRSLGGPLY